MNNYILSRDRAQSYFLSFDQQEIIQNWNLIHDERWLYVDFLNTAYRICRSTGSIYRCEDHAQAGFEEVLSIFDLLCHESSGKYLSGRFAPVNSLKNRPRAIGVGTSFHTEIAAKFDAAPDAFRAACISLGGISAATGDIGFQFPVFRELNIQIKFYHADEDFPASVTVLWDENTLQYLYYETTFYIAGFLLKSILDRMSEDTAP